MPAWFPLTGWRWPAGVSVWSLLRLPWPRWHTASTSSPTCWATCRWARCWCWRGTQRARGAVGAARRTALAARAVVCARAGTEPAAAARAVAARLAAQHRGRGRRRVAAACGWARTRCARWVHRTGERGSLNAARGAGVAGAVAARRCCSRRRWRSAWARCGSACARPCRWRLLGEPLARWLEAGPAADGAACRRRPSCWPLRSGCWDPACWPTAWRGRACAARGWRWVPLRSASGSPRCRRH